MTTPSATSLTLSENKVPTEFIERIPLRFARENALIAVAKAEHDGVVTYTLACGHPDRFWAIDRVAYVLDAQVDAASFPESDVLALISKCYHAEAQDVATVADELAAEQSLTGALRLTEDVLELDDKAPAVKLVHAMLLQAVKQRASDIHVEPREDGVRVRFRIDGVLYDRAMLRQEVREGVASRVKVMGKMDIAERRLPQDGGVTIRIGERQIDLRISTIPNQYGERIVMRLLDKHTGLLTLSGLGLSLDNQHRTERLMKLSHGIILVTGPTGCGKTTTLYAMLSSVNSADLNILTLEDPVEYQLPGISQTQVSEKKGLTFARGLRSLVRQDPDIIMVGEIRDLETASVAIQSALTGHLVLSTLHTNDAPSSITRLLDLGIEPYLAASSINAAIAQRLVRRICPHCRDSVPFSVDAALLDGWTKDDVDYLSALGVKDVAKKHGCEACFNTGFIGRNGIYEFLVINDAVRELITRSASAGEIKKTAIERGMTTLRRDGLSKVASLATTLDEVREVTQMDLE